MTSGQIFVTQIGTNGIIKGFIQTQSVNSYLLNDSLTLIIEVAEPEEQTVEPKFIRDFQTMKNISDFSDFTYRVGGQNFPVHKVVLSGKKFNF